MFDLIAALALGYLLGSLPTAALAARLKGKNIFELGSGNMGAMNSLRNLGWGVGIAVGLVDAGKGVLASYLGLQMAEAVGRVDAAALVVGLAAALGAVLGHAFSPWVHFQGGKAIATTFGITMPFEPLLGLFFLGFIVGLYLITRHMNLSGLLTAILLPVIAFFLLQRQGWFGDELFTLTTGMIPIGLIGAIKHAQAWARERSARREEPV